jgi:hypothetical protein
MLRRRTGKRDSTKSNTALKINSGGLLVMWLLSSLLAAGFLTLLAHPRKLIVFKHDSHLGNARSGQLFDLVKIIKNTELPRDWKDYTVEPINKDLLPKGVTLIEKL